MTAGEAAFERLILGGAPMGSLQTVAAQLAGDTTPMGPTLCGLLGTSPGSTYAQGAALVQSRVASGLAPF